MGNWVKQNCPPSEAALMLLDLPETTVGNHPPTIGNYIPDLYIKSGRLILGEAKTARDIETKHSREQYAEYLKHLSQYQESLFIMAVPWDCVPLTKSLIRRIQNNAAAVHVQTVILEKLPG
jgi:hypothetical protein